MFTKRHTRQRLPGILVSPERSFDGMVDIVNRDEGAVIKYDRDNIPVLWSGPLESLGLAMGHR